MKVMKELYVLILLILLGIIYYFYKGIEGFKQDDKKLRNPMQLSANVFRSSNTILTAVSSFDDHMDSLPLPAEIKDNYNEWIEKGFISQVKDQMLCGGCWAFAACGSLADRLTIATNGKWNPPYGLSEQILISCGGEMGMDFYQGCEGGIPHFAIDALTKDGVPADIECLDCGGVPDSGDKTSEGGGTKRSDGVVNPNNTSTCSKGGNVYAATDYTWWQTGCDGSTSCSITSSSSCPCDGINAQMKKVEGKNFDTKYKTVGEAHSYSSHGKDGSNHTIDLWPNIPQDVIDGNVIRMKKAIYYEGPLTVGFQVRQDFYTYWPTANADNYYRYDGRSPMAGGHAVIIVGWKTMSDGTPVWIAKNSWGENGGYGFPDGPKWTNPVTGKTEPKYIGGFWNHVMGENDGFIESNAIGAHPDLKVPQISKFFPNEGADIPNIWYEKFTLRDINKMAIGEAPQTPQEPHSDSGHQQSPADSSPIIITKFDAVTLTLDNITPQSLQEFFSDDKNLYVIGANNTDNIAKIIEFLPTKKELSEDDIRVLVRNISDIVKGYIVIATRGDMNNYYYLSGVPSDWMNLFNRNYIKRAATIKKISNDIYYNSSDLRLDAPIIQLSVKTESFETRKNYRWIF